MSDELLFADLKVIDMSSWIAAPVAATILVDFGAQVIKVEPPLAGDGYRNFAMMASSPNSDIKYTGDGQSQQALNRSKSKVDQGRRSGAAWSVRRYLHYQYHAADASRVGFNL